VISATSSGREKSKEISVARDVIADEVPAVEGELSKKRIG
jgi:hypothetical protein